MIDVLIPVLGRPQRVAPLLENLRGSTEVSLHVLFVCSLGDDAEIAAVEEAGADYLTFDGPPANGQYAKKINQGYAATDHPWLFLGADDLEFFPGWAEQALQLAGERLSVVSTNDRANYFVRQGLLATHSLVRRSYIKESGGSLDGPGSVYHEGYSHNFVDCEFSVLARTRRQFGFARRSIVRHRHPVFKTAPMDSTYEIGLRDFVEDRSLFIERMADYRHDQLVKRFSVAARGRR